MFHIAEDYKFIFAVLIFYGFLYTCFVMNGNTLYGLNMQVNDFTFMNYSLTNNTTDCTECWHFLWGNYSYPMFNMTCEFAWNTTIPCIQWTSCSEECGTGLIPSGATNPLDTFRLFLSQLFYLPFTTGDWQWFGFLNWAIVGVSIYLFIKTMVDMMPLT